MDVLVEVGGMGVLLGVGVRVGVLVGPPGVGDGTNDESLTCQFSTPA